MPYKAIRLERGPSRAKAFRIALMPRMSYPRAWLAKSLLRGGLAICVVQFYSRV